MPVSSTALTVIYTANLRADFDLMARTATHIQTIRQAYGVAPYPILLLDIGGAWSDEAWVSVATEHRAPYLVLDAMAYHVINADGLDVGGILGLQTVIQAQLMDHTIVKKWQWRDIALNVGPRATAPCVAWSWERHPNADAWYKTEAGRLTLFPIEQIGQLDVHYPNMTVQSAILHTVAESTRPDPTIVATTEYVEDEARYYESKQKGNYSDG